MIPYKRPNILFLKGCFITDCYNIEDVFEERILDLIDNCELDTKKYDKIPAYFISPTEWPTHTNILCWNCDCKFDTYPKFIPKSISLSSNRIPVYGNFCSWSCALSHIFIYFKEDRWEKCELLKYAYNIFNIDGFDKVLVSPSKYKMVQYGGSMNMIEFKSKLK